MSEGPEEATSPRSPPSDVDESPLRSLAILFLRLGTIAFGGPAAHIAMMRDEVVVRRRWLSDPEFLDLLGATNLIPGPNSTEMAIHIGYLRAGWRGLIVAGVCFIAPAAVIVTAIAWAYMEYGTTPEAGGLLYGIKPVILAIVGKALWDLGRTAVKGPWFLVAGAGAMALYLLGVNELLILLGGGALILGIVRLRSRHTTPTVAKPAIAVRPRLRLLAPIVLVAGLGVLVVFGSVTMGSSREPDLGPLFLTFVKIGSVLYGSGYVLLAFLRNDFVHGLGWISDQQLLDAVAVGQVTPGPVFTTATFIGYVVAGPPGALVATLGIFLPAFLFVAATHPWVPRIRSSPRASAFLDGVNITALGLMAGVLVVLGRAAVVDVPSALLAIGAAFLVLRYRVNATWLILGGAILGIALGLAGLLPA
jgi:chromate transporter